MLRCMGRMMFGLLLILGLSTATAVAETPEATVSGSGEVTLRPVPTMLRVRVELSSQGGTVKAALARLQERREAAVVKLKASEADADSIKFGHPIVSKVLPFSRPSDIRPASGPYSQPVPFSSAPSYPSTSPAYGPTSSTYAAPVPARPPSRPRVVKIPPLYQASTTLSVDWPLAAENMDEVLVASEALKKRIAAADLAGAKQPDRLTPEQQEILEEASVRPSAYETSLPQPVVGPAAVYGPYAPPQAVSNGVEFLFVARISPEQRKAALAKAFAKAKAQAGEMAGAAGRDLGSLTSLDGQFDSGAAAGWRIPCYPSAIEPVFGGSDLNLAADESAGTDPGSIAFHAQVHATFHLR